MPKGFVNLGNVCQKSAANRVRRTITLLCLLALSATTLAQTAPTGTETTDWKFSGTGIIAAIKKAHTDSPPGTGTYTYTGDSLQVPNINASKDFMSIAGVATDDATGTFTLSDIIVKGAACASTDELLGFLYVTNGTTTSTTPFSGIITGGNITVETSKGSAYGAFFRDVNTSTPGDSQWASISSTNIAFGTISVTSTDNTNAAAGAAGFVAGVVASGADITIAGITAESKSWATGAQFTGDFEGKLTTTGKVDISGAHEAFGILVGGDMKGTIALNDIEVAVTDETPTGNAYGVAVIGAVSGTLSSTGTIKVTGTSQSVWGVGLQSVADTAILTFGGIEVKGTDGAVGIAVGTAPWPSTATDKFEGKVTTGAITVDGGKGNGTTAGIGVLGAFNLNSESSIGKINVSAETSGNVYGILAVGTNNLLVIANDITVKNSGTGSAFGINLQGITGTDKITVADNVKITTDHSNKAAGINVASNLTLDILSGKTLTTNSIWVGGNLTFSTGGGTLDLTLDAPQPCVIVTGTIDLTNAKLNINGYTETPTVVISSTGALSNFNANNITFGGASTVDYMSASAKAENNTVVVQTDLTWYSTDTNRKAHGTFTIDSGNTFTLDKVLTDNSASTNKNGWDGNSLTKKGAGTLILNGINTYTGLTTVEAGTLGGNGSIAGAVVVKNGATLSPGASIGTLTVKSVTFESGSTYFVEIDKTAGKSDCLTVNDGDIIIQPNATLKIDILSGTGNRNDKFLVIAAEGSQFKNPSTAPFDNLIQGFGIEFHQQLRNDGLWIEWNETNPGFADAVRSLATPNALGTAEAVDRIFVQGETGNITRLYSALAGMDVNDPQAAANVFTQLHGEVFASSKEAATRMQRRFQNLFPTGRDILVSDGNGSKAGIYGQAVAPTKMWNRWGTFTGDWNNRKNLGRFSGYDSWSVGLATGIDRAITTNILLGGAIGYDTSSQSFYQINSQAHADTFRTAVYGSWYNGNCFLDSYISYSKNLYSTKRNINIDNRAFTAVAESRYNDDLTSVGAELGRTKWLGICMVTPSIGLHYMYFYTPTITEKEGGDANLFVSSNHYQSLRLPISVKANKIFRASHGITWIPELRMSYIRELLDDSVQVQTAFNNVRDVTFEADSGKWGRGSGKVGAGVSMLCSERVRFCVDYDYEVYNYTSVDTFTATLGVTW